MFQLTDTKFQKSVNSFQTDAFAVIKDVANVVNYHPKDEQEYQELTQAKQTVMQNLNDLHNTLQNFSSEFSSFEVNKPSNING